MVAREGGNERRHHRDVATQVRIGEDEAGDGHVSRAVTENYNYCHVPSVLALAITGTYLHTQDVCIYIYT